MEHRIMRKLIKKCESGITLVEMLTAVSVVIILGGSSYAVFNTAIKSYHLTQSKLIQTQRTRVALNKINTDLSQIQADTSDELLTIFSEDIPTESGEMDIVSFVTLVKTDPDPFLIDIGAVDTLTAQPFSDVRRVAYYIGQQTPIEERQVGNIPPPYTGTQQPGQVPTGQEVPLSLYRIVTTALDPEFVVAAFMNSEAVPPVDENGTPIDFKVDPIIDGIVNFDVKYFDGESQYETWTQTDAVPIAISILISVIDEEKRQSTTAQTFAQPEGGIPPDALTQSTMIYLPPSANSESSAQAAVE